MSLADEQQQGARSAQEGDDAVGIGSDLGSGLGGLGAGADLGGGRGLGQQATSGDVRNENAARGAAMQHDAPAEQSPSAGTTGHIDSPVVGRSGGADDSPGTAGGGGTYMGSGTTGFGAGSGTTGTGPSTAGLGGGSDVGGGTTGPGDATGTPV